MERWLTELAQAHRTFARVRGRPLVTVAFAMSEDACLAETRGTRTEISDLEAMRLTHALRALHGEKGAVLVGIGTALADDPRLTTRLVDGPNARRIVLDSQLRLPLSSRLLHSTPSPALVVGTEWADVTRERALSAEGAQVVRLPSSPRGISLEALLSHLHSLGIESLMIEGGARIVESFILDGFVDHMCVTCSPKKLDNPEAVRLPKEIEATVRAFIENGGEPFGNDTVVAGPFGAARQSSAHAGSGAFEHKAAE